MVQTLLDNESAIIVNERALGALGKIDRSTKWMRINSLAVRKIGITKVMNTCTYITKSCYETNDHVLGTTGQFVT